MSVIRSQFVAILLGGLLCFSAVTPVYATQRHAKHKPPAKQEPVKQEEIQPAQPPPPLTLQQMPASAPEVSYRNGDLTIVARNSTLAEILRQVHAQTGAAIDMSADATGRVVGSFGPGTARDVLAKLLNGSNFNYVMVGSAVNPNALEHLVLMPKTPDMPASTVPQPANAAQNAAFSPPGNPSSGASASDMTDDQDDNESDTVAQPIEQPAQTASPDEEHPPNPPGIKTPEQLLQELQREQQLLQQQQNPQGLPPTRQK